MKTESEYRYFQFPLCIVRNILKEPETAFQQIISYSVVSYGIKAVELSEYDVFRQLMYDYYRQQDKIEPALLKTLKSYINEDAIELNEDYNGFTGKGEFDIEVETPGLEEIYSNDSDFKERANLHYQIHCAAKFLNVQIGNIKTTIDRYNEIKKQKAIHENKYGNEPMPGIKTELLWDWETVKKYNEEENELLCACIAIKSIIGQNDFTATHKSVICMRMIGAKSNKVLNDFLKDKQLKKIYDNYSKRYTFDKLISRLVSRGFIQSKISLGRSIYLSAKYDMPQLQEAIIEKRRKKDFKRQEAEARKNILSAAI